MKERSLILFTLLFQMAVGAFLTLWALHPLVAREASEIAADRLFTAAPFTIGLLIAMGLVASFFHLGSPHNAWRAVANLRSSWLSREILFTLLFTATAMTCFGLRWSQVGPSVLWELSALLAGICGLSLIYCMARVYMLRSIPVWNSWVTPTSFFVTTFLLGGLGFALVTFTDPGISPQLHQIILPRVAVWSLTLLAIEVLLTPFWVTHIAPGPQATLGMAHKSSRVDSLILGARLVLMLIGASLAVLLRNTAGSGSPAPLWTLTFTSILLAEIIGRARFYQARERTSL